MGEKKGEKELTSDVCGSNRSSAHGELVQVSPGRFPMGKTRKKRGKKGNLRMGTTGEKNKHPEIAARTKTCKRKKKEKNERRKEDLLEFERGVNRDVTAGRKL